MSSEHKKLMAAAVLLVVAIAVFFVFRRSEAGVSDSIRFVCIDTGRIYKLKRDSFNYVPANNPDTGAATLLPVEQVDGQFLVDRRYARELSEGTELGELNKAHGHVDPHTLQVRQ